jgi:hypothetical protein
LILFLEKLNFPRATVPEKPGLKYVTHAAAGAAVARLDLVYTGVHSSTTSN